VMLKSFKHLGDGSADTRKASAVSAQNVEAKLVQSSSESTVFATSVKHLMKVPGSYEVTFSVHVKKGGDRKYGDLAGVTLVVNKQGSVATKDIQVTISLSNTRNLRNEQSGQKLAYGNVLKKAFVVDNAYKFLHIAVANVKSSILQQLDVNLVLQKEDDGKTTVVKVPLLSTGNFVASIDVEGVDFLSIMAGSGRYHARVLVGSHLLEQDVDWSLGSFTFIYASDLYPPPVNLFAAKPVIDHQFHPSQKTGGSVLPLVFDGIVVAGFLGLVYVLFTQGGFASSGGIVWDVRANETLSAILFIVSIAGASIGLNTFFFFSLNIFEALSMLGVCLVACFLLGRLALGSLQARNAIKFGLTSTAQLVEGSKKDN
jgi:hypothetical protein